MVRGRDDENDPAPNELLSPQGLWGFEMVIIGVDTGGTFTDFVFKKGDQWGIYKLLSTPANPAAAVLEGLDYIARKERKQIIHGSTVATNAILERKGAKTALITNKGFEDVIEIGRQNRSRLYDLAYPTLCHLKLDLVSREEFSTTARNMNRWMWKKLRGWLNCSNSPRQSL